QAITRDANYNFDLIGVLAIDNALNRADFRAGEKAFQVLSGLLRLTDKRIIIQTGLPQYHCFLAFTGKDPAIFYDKELAQRKQLGLPPYRHIGIVKVRGRSEEKVRNTAATLHERLNSANNDRSVKIISVNSSQPSRLRGNFYWQVLTSCGSALKLSRFLKINLKDFRHSGIIVTVDIDPI
ncbi:MAG: hypothetical protein ACM3IL_01575, partial [Deltaproteobacteria bacterium]